MQTSGRLAPLAEQDAHVYTDGVSTGSRGPGGYGVVLTWKGKIEERMLNSGLSATMSTPLPAKVV
jgi:ribonuclease HI